MLDILTIAACGIGLVGCVVFGIAWHIRSGGAWLRNVGLVGEVGKVLMGMNAALASILALILAARLFGDWSGRRGAVLVLVLIYMLKPWWWLRVMWHAHSRQEPVRPTHRESDQVGFLRRYGKAAAAVLIAVFTSLQVYYGGDNHIDGEEAVQIGIATATAVGTYVLPLAHQYTWTKTAYAVIMAVLQALATVALGGLDANEYLILILAALQVVGVGAAPAVSNNGARAGGVTGADRGSLRAGGAVMLAAGVVTAGALVMLAASSASAGRPRPPADHAPTFATPYPPVPVCDLD